MSCDRPPPERRGARGDEDAERVGRVAGEPATGNLRTAASRVMATVAAKVQGMIPPAKTASAASFLGQEEVRSAGTAGTGYVTVDSAMNEEQPVEEGQHIAEAVSGSGTELFSPQQARRLREMEQEAPLLYQDRRVDFSAGDTGAVGVPPIPHSSSSESGQAEAIQAEVRRQMHAFMVVQTELQGRVAALVEENQMLRQVASSSVESVSEGPGLHAGKGSWLSGLRRNLMGFVQQVPSKATAVTAFAHEGWQMSQVAGKAQPSAPPTDSAYQGAGQVPTQAASSTAAKNQALPNLALGYGLGPHPIAPPPPPTNHYSDPTPQVQPSGLGPTGVPKPGSQVHAASPPGLAAGGSNPLDAMMSGILQLQGVVADLAASRTGSSAGAASGGPEVVRPGVQELVKLPPPTLEGALGFSDWVHAVKPSMSDLSDTSGECWRVVLEEAQNWYNNKFVPATPIARVRLHPPESQVDKEPKWSRVRHRMEHLIIQCCSDSVRAELSSARVSGVLNILCKLHVIYKPGGVAERSEALKQVQNPRAADSPIDAVLKLRMWKRWMTRLTGLRRSPA